MSVIDSVLKRGFEPHHGLYVTINAPEFFDDPRFIEYIEGSGAPVATWHKSGNAADEYSDVCVFVEPCMNGDGSNSDMPADIWNTIIEALRRRYGPEGDGVPGRNRDAAICVRITNLDT